MASLLPGRRSSHEPIEALQTAEEDGAAQEDVPIDDVLEAPIQEALADVARAAEVAVVKVLKRQRIKAALVGVENKNNEYQ